MYQRLVAARPGPAQPLVVPVVGAVVMLGILLAAPWGMRNADAARAQVDTEVKQVAFGLSVLVAAGIFVFAIVQIGVGLRVLGSVYGRDASRGVVLASPWGVLGHPRQRIRLTRGEVGVRLVSEAPMGSFYRYGIQRVYFSQGGVTLHTLSYVKYSEQSRARLVGWLTDRGITPVFEGDPEVLPG